MSTTAAVGEDPTRAGAGRYLACWLALLLLTGLTFALSTVDLGGWSLALALTIAVTKGSIVALFFMHLWDHVGAIRLVLATAVLFVAVLSALVVADVLTRFPLALPPR
jgi:cytochrome c oxidase subunit IV